jgi:hypothetical protein
MDKVESQHIASATDETAKSQVSLEKNESKQPHLIHTQTLGSIRLRDQHTGEVILVPTPTKDPNDPLVLHPPHRIRNSWNLELESFVQGLHNRPRLFGYFPV